MRILRIGVAPIFADSVVSKGPELEKLDNGSQSKGGHRFNLTWSLHKLVDSSTRSKPPVA